MEWHRTASGRIIQGMSVRLQNGSFYGRAGAPVRLEDVVLAETSYGDGFVVPVHAHAHPFFCLLLEGSMVEHFEKRRRMLHRRAAFFHPAEADHAETFEGSPARLFNIQFGNDWLRALAQVDVTLPAEHIPLPDGRVPWLAAQIHDEFRGGRERLIVEGLLLAMVGVITQREASRERSGAPSWMADVVERIHSSDAPNIALAELARIAQVHPSHLARTFRALHGCTLGEYTRTLRVQRAREMLRTGTLPLSQVALACGFADQSHFTRVFRRVTGVTPAAYRRDAGR